MPRRVVLLAEPLDTDAEQRLANGAEVIRPKPAGDLAQRIRELGSAADRIDALVVRTTTQVSADAIAATKNLRVIGVAGVGTENVDEDAAQRHRVKVLTASGAADAVAEFTVALMLQLLRPIPRLSAACAAGEFAALRKSPHGVELRDLTVGILGCGRIGSRVARICATGFGARVIYHDIAPVGPFDFAAHHVSPDELLASADILTLHTPLTRETHGWLNAQRLAALKPTALVINTARGAIIEMNALVNALRSGRTAGAALDVTDPEPLPTDHPLFGMPNVIITPHVAARTERGLRSMFGIVDEVLTFLREYPC